MEKVQIETGLRFDFFISDDYVKETIINDGNCMNCGSLKKLKTLNNKKTASSIICTECGTSLNIGL